MLSPSDRQLRDGIAGHRGRVDQHLRGAITPDEFRPMRLSYGLYYQLDHTSHMQRIKIPGRHVTVAQMNCLNDIADTYGRGVAHVTTRQDIQIHWVPLAEVGTMYERLHEVGITTRGACSDSVRNVTGVPAHGPPRGRAVRRRAVRPARQRLLPLQSAEPDAAAQVQDLVQQLRRATARRARSTTSASTRTRGPRTGSASRASPSLSRGRPRVAAVPRRPHARLRARRRRC